MCPRVEVDREECSGCGLCYNEECPDVFMERDGHAEIKEEFRTGEPGVGEIPESLKACAEGAADACPVSAIAVFED